MSWLFLIFLLPLVLYAFSYFRLLNQSNGNTTTAVYAYWLAVAVQLILIGTLSVKGAEWV